MKLILFAMAVAILYQLSNTVFASNREQEPEAEKERSPIFRLGRKPNWEKDITHRGRILEEDSRKDR